MNPSSRRQFLRFLGIGTASMFLPLSACSHEENPPNILLIMADDLGAKELGCYGHPHHQTPNLDELAGTGVRFRTCYAAPVCSPTRVMLMTGQYGFRNGWTDNRYRPGGAGDSEQAQIGDYHVTFADMLKDRGYRTAAAGKWQLPGELPTLVHDTGFDEYSVWMNVIPGSIDYDGGLEKPGKPSRFHYPGILQNGKQLPTGPNDYGPDVYTDFLIDFIKKSGDQPFLAYYPMCLTHLPWEPTPDQPDIQSASKPERLRANVEYMDKMIGRLVQALEESGLRDNTIILFTGDNGTKYNGKYTPTELGARVPMIVNSPNFVQSGVVSDELLDLSDVMPTIADFTGASLPVDRVIDGHSFAHIVKGEPGPVRDWCFSFLSGKRVLRDKRWLLEYNSPDEFGLFFDCGDSRNGEEYKEVTRSNDPQVIAARKRFTKILEKLPVPDMHGPEAETFREKMREEMRLLPANLQRFCPWLDLNLPYDSL